MYDAAGQRVRKVIENQNGVLAEERMYLSNFEAYRKHTGANGDLVRETLQVMDDQQRIALVETRNDVNDGTAKQLIRYQASNHLGSASLELDYHAQVISYEEYYPYGTTSYQAVRNQMETSKRYRYTGMERDDESGLNYHRFRHYLSWLGRWTNPDPIGITGGINSYGYSNTRPINFVDQRGTDGIRFDKNSEISAKTMFNSIQTDPELEPVLKNVFLLDKDTIRVKVNQRVSDTKSGVWIQIDLRNVNGNVEFTTRTGGASPQSIPDWFVSAVVAIHSGEWTFTSATAIYQLYDDHILEVIDPHGSGPSTPTTVAPNEGLMFGLTINNSGRNGIGGVVTVATEYRFDSKVNSKTVPQQKAQLFSTLSDQFSITHEHAKNSPEVFQLVETFFHELAAHAGQHTLGKPDVHKQRNVDDLAGEIKKYFHPPPKRTP